GGAGPALIDVIGGQVQVMFDTVVGSIEHIRGGRLRALAVTGAARSDVLPDIPTVGDFVPGYESSGWHGVAAPKNTPTEIIDKLNKEINVALTNPGSRHELPILAVRCLRAQLPTSANSSSRKRRNGPR